MSAEIVLPQPQSFLFIVSGPAGVGKTTLCERMLTELAPRVQRAVTSTTRPRREGERDGVDYHFLTREAYDAKKAAGAFYETAEVHGHGYGTLREEVDGRLRRGADVLLNIDVQGADSFRAMAAKPGDFLHGRLVTIFVLPESLRELRLRLEGRATDAADVVERRMQNAEAEVAHWPRYDYCFVSDTREADFSRLRAIHTAVKLRVRRESVSG